MKKIILYYILHVKKIDLSSPLLPPFCRAIESQLLQKKCVLVFRGKRTYLLKKVCCQKKKDFARKKEDFFLMQRIFFSYQTLGFVVME